MYSVYQHGGFPAKTSVPFHLPSTDPVQRRPALSIHSAHLFAAQFPCPLLLLPLLLSTSYSKVLLLLLLRLVRSSAPGVFSLDFLSSPLLLTSPPYS